MVLEQSTAELSPGGSALNASDTARAADKAREPAHAASAFGTAVPERESDHKIAFRMHRRRFYMQALGWSAKILAAAISVPLLVTYARYQTAMCHVPFRHSAGCRLVIASQFIPVLIFFVLLLGNFIYHVWQYHRWEVAMANAKEFADRESVANGWTDVFSIYVRTKRRSYHVMTWGLLALLYAVVSVAGDTVVLTHGTAVSLSWMVPIANLFLGAGLLVVAYFLGSAYLPGDVIVRHTLALLIYAISNITDPNLAKHQAAQEADEFVRANPWWFYSH